jgi:hypothetical protein
MNLLSKLRMSPTRETSARAAATPVRTPGHPLHAPAVSPGAAEGSNSGRFSNGLKEFLWQLHDIHRGNLLDMGAVSQGTLNFFIDRGFRVYTEDFLNSWSLFLRAEEEEVRATPAAAERADVSSSARAERFLDSNLRHAAGTFDAVLLWDLLDYLDRDVAALVAGKLSSLLREDGAILAIFHARVPEQFQRYRVLDAHHLELVAAPAPAKHQHVYQNREIQDLFEGFRSSKTFVGRDQLREGVFIK